MSDVVISAENLGKRYTIGHQTDQGGYVTLREVMMRNVGSFWQKAKDIVQGKPIIHGDTREEVWALKEVSFEIRRGEAVGIIGRNGAGKSTLLKILSRITEPSAGRVTIKGRVASLLEVGTGFHPELTGRENIYLNGAILGMARREIRGKFDEIVAFAETEKFLDTPVKYYSSGMYVRLAFAVAAHLEPEILIIDEVLAVGDLQFQKKCLGKMEDVSTKEGRTVLFVSHNMNAIEQICSKAFFLDKGLIEDHGKASFIIRRYLGFENKNRIITEWVNESDCSENPWFKPLRFYLTDNYGNNIMPFVSNHSKIFVNIECEIIATNPSLTVGYAIYTEEGVLLYWSYQTDQSEDKWPILKRGHCILRGQIPERFLNEGIYKIELIGSLHFQQWLFEPGKSAPCIFMSIQGGLSDSPYWAAKRPGVLAPVLEWQLLSRRPV